MNEVFYWTFRVAAVSDDLYKTNGGTVLENIEASVLSPTAGKVEIFFGNTKALKVLVEIHSKTILISPKGPIKSPIEKFSQCLMENILNEILSVNSEYECKLKGR